MQNYKQKSNKMPFWQYVLFIALALAVLVVALVQYLPNKKQGSAKVTAYAADSVEGFGAQFDSIVYNVPGSFVVSRENFYTFPIVNSSSSVFCAWDFFANSLQWRIVYDTDIGMYKFSLLDIFVSYYYFTTRYNGFVSSRKYPELITYYITEYDNFYNNIQTDSNDGSVDGHGLDGLVAGQTYIFTYGVSFAPTARFEGFIGAVSIDPLFNSSEINYVTVHYGVESNEWGLNVPDSYKRNYVAYQYSDAAGNAFNVSFFAFDAINSSRSSPAEYFSYFKDYTLFLTAEDKSFNYQNYAAGYNAGYDNGQAFGFNQGYTDGRLFGKEEGYQLGYQAGVEGANKYSFFSLISAVVDAPIQALTGLLDFNVFGYDMKNFYLSIFTVCIIVTILKAVT